MLKKIRINSERGQAIILIAFSLIGLVAIVGLMVDGGILLVEYARLKRGIDSASIAAASQFRKGFVGADLENAGREFLKFNQSDATVTIFTCDYPNTNHDATLCSAPGQPKRKLVRVTARRYVPFGFMRVVGMNGTWIEATSVGEAASIDLVLVIDTSTSMAYETKPISLGGTDELDPADPVSGDPGDNPEVCNTHMADGLGSGRCEPLGKVIDAASAFVDQLFFPYDRVALVATTGQAVTNSNIGSRDPVTVLDFSDTQATVQNSLSSLKVYQPNRCPFPLVYDPNNLTPCLQFQDAYTPGTYYRTQLCIPRYLGNPLTGIRDPTTCGPSDIGGGLYAAGYEFANARQDSFWGVIALFGGPVNASIEPDNLDNPTTHPNGFCPGSMGTITWTLPGGSGFCRDEDPMPASYHPPVTALDTQARKDAFNTYVSAYDWSTYDWKTATRHHYTINTTNPSNPVKVYPSNYDSDDYARDAADFVAAPSPNGQGATLYSICMGNYCRAYPNLNDPASGELLGRYMALNAGDQYDLLGNVTTAANHGLYFYAENSDVVGDVFGAIADNILTRISQ